MMILSYNFYSFWMNLIIYYFYCNEFGPELNFRWCGRNTCLARWITACDRASAPARVCSALDRRRASSTASTPRCGANRSVRRWRRWCRHRRPPSRQRWASRRRSRPRPAVPVAVVAAAAAAVVGTANRARRCVRRRWFSARRRRWQRQRRRQRWLGTGRRPPIIAVRLMLCSTYWVRRRRLRWRRLPSRRSRRYRRPSQTSGSVPPT